MHNESQNLTNTFARSALYIAGERIQSVGAMFSGIEPHHSCVVHLGIVVVYWFLVTCANPHGHTRLTWIWADYKHGRDIKTPMATHDGHEYSKTKTCGRDS